MSERGLTRVLSDLARQVVDDLWNDPLRAFPDESFGKHLADCVVRLPGAKGTGPADRTLDLRQVGRQDRHCRLVLAGVRGHGQSRAVRTDEFNPDGRGTRRSCLARNTGPLRSIDDALGATAPTDATGG